MSFWKKKKKKKKRTVVFAVRAVKTHLSYGAREPAWLCPLYKYEWQPLFLAPEQTSQASSSSSSSSSLLAGLKVPWDCCSVKKEPVAVGLIWL